jgi:hypothetical protein
MMRRENARRSELNRGDISSGLGSGDRLKNGNGMRKVDKNLLTAEDEDDIPGGMRIERGVIKTFGVHNNGVSSEIGRREGVRGES